MMKEPCVCGNCTKIYQTTMLVWSFSFLQSLPHFRHIYVHYESSCNTYMKLYVCICIMYLFNVHKVDKIKSFTLEYLSCTVDVTKCMGVDPVLFRSNYCLVPLPKEEGYDFISVCLFVRYITQKVANRFL